MTSQSNPESRSHISLESRIPKTLLGTLLTGGVRLCEIEKKSAEARAYYTPQKVLKQSIKTNFNYV